MKNIADKLGRPLRDLRISLTDQCNFRCAYCMPKELFGPDFAFLPQEAVLSDDEIIRVAQSFHLLGVQKIRLTGGEPLLRPQVDRLIGRLVSEVGIADISLTTNASLLPRYARALKAAGLRRLNISLDSLDPDRFAQMSGGRSSPQAVLKGIEAARSAGLPAKINMVARKGVNECDILPMIAFCRREGLTLRFIEFMDVGESNGWKLKEVVPAERILETISREYAFEPVDPDYRGEVATRYRFLDNGVEFGVITSISQPFCRDCNRARLSADGKVYTCLFASSGHDLKALLRAGIDQQALDAAIEQIWLGRKDQYSADRSRNPEAPSSPERRKIEMSYIGG